MTLAERAAAYNAAFPQYPGSHLWVDDCRRLQGVWILGHDYKGSGFYGSYPPAYLTRISALFRDQTHVLHLCSGSLPCIATRTTLTVDCRCTTGVTPGIQADILKLPLLDASFDLAYIDPPYSKADAEKYQTALPDRRLALREIARVIRSGGFCVWLDTLMPIYSNTLWQWVGAIGLWRSSGHRVRGIMIFQRV